MKEQTDLEAFIALYARFGIDIVVESDNDNLSVQLGVDSPDYQTQSEKFVGQDRVYTILLFTKEGKFIYQEFWGD